MTLVYTKPKYMLYYVISHSDLFVNKFMEKDNEMFQYILFDLDGTLTDPKIGITKSVQYSLASFGITEKNLDVLEPFIGPPLKDSFMEFYSLTDVEAEQAIKKYRERFETIGLYENEVYPGIDKMLCQLKKAGKKLAVASSKPTIFVERILKYFSIDQYFDVVVGSELDGTRTKKEEVVSEALSRLFQDGSMDTEHTVMVGDRKFDIEGAREFHITGVGVSYGYGQGDELREAGADYVVDSVQELQKLLLNDHNLIQDSVKNTKKAFTKETLTNNTAYVQEAALSGIQKIWNLLLPAVVYYLSCSVFIMVVITIINAFGYLLGTDAVVWIIVHEQEVTVTINGLGMIVGFLLIRRAFLKEAFWREETLVLKTGKIFNLWVREEVTLLKQKMVFLVPVILLAITSSIFSNLIMGYLNIAQLSGQYQATESAQYSVPIWLGLILYGLISPLAEETLFRGILYNRMKRYYSMPAGVILSSLLFGFYHMNLVQGIYGTVIGLLIVMCYEKTESFTLAFVFHATANIVIFLLSQSRILKTMLATPVSCVLFFLLTIIIIIYLFKMTQRRDNMG